MALIGRRTRTVRIADRFKLSVLTAYSTALHTHDTTHTPSSFNYLFSFFDRDTIQVGGSRAERLACWTRAQYGLGSNRSRDAVG